MKTLWVTAMLLLVSASCLYGFPGPFDGKMFKGRIALSNDGNYHDEDDWAAFPVIVAIIDAFNAMDQIVHVDYCNTMTKLDPRFYREMVESVLGAASRYDIPRHVLFDCQKDLEGALKSIEKAINASSEDDPLYYILSGPMDVPLRGILRSAPDKRQYVYCISHSNWNDGYTWTEEQQTVHICTKREVIATGINWLSCKEGSRELSHPGLQHSRSTPEQWKLYHWLRDSKHADLNWIFTRLEAMGRGDFCDASSAYFLMTGDEAANLTKVKYLLDEKKMPGVTDPRPYVRLEAEDFQILDNYEVAYRIDKSASHYLSIRLASLAPGRIRTVFEAIYTPNTARYDIDVRYYDHHYGHSKLSFFVNGIQQGEPWLAAANDRTWKIHTIPNLRISGGDEIMVHVHGDRGEYGKLDYVQFNFKE